MNYSFSLIIPTFKEVDNIPALIHRILSLELPTHSFEVILVDDNSQDGTVELVAQFQQTIPWLRLIVRQGIKSLSQAIIDGINIAHYTNLIVMDADLSHPPEAIPEMLGKLIKENADIVMGSRFLKKSRLDADWPTKRKLGAKGTAWVTKTLLRLPVYDPLSGFFAIRKEKLQSVKLDAIGWKIALEIIIKCHCVNIIEIPIHFKDRSLGKSKMGSHVALAYLYHMMRLMRYRYGRHYRYFNSQ